MAVDIQITGPDVDSSHDVLTPEALDCVAYLQRRFGPRRDRLLTDRSVRRVEITGPTEPKMVINALNCGAEVIHGLMEDAATAEISRSQVWQRIAAGVGLDTGEEPMPDAAGPDLGGFDVNRQEDPSGGFDVNRQEGARRVVRVTRELVTRVADEELAAILAEPGVDADAVRQAHGLFAQVALADGFPDFLTLPAYDLID